MRHSLPQVDTLYNVVLDPRRLIRWLYVGRLSIASSIFVAAFFTWFQTEPQKTFISTATLVGDVIVEEGASVWYGVVISAEIGRASCRERV